MIMYTSRLILLGVSDKLTEDSDILIILKLVFDLQNELIIFQCPAETENLESLDIYKDQIPDGVGLHSLRYVDF